MPPYININPEDITRFYKEVDSYIESHNNEITSAILFAMVHEIRYFYKGCYPTIVEDTINERYVNTCRKYNGYDLWVKK